MVQDARSRIQEHGSVGALLVGGDIAFKGDPQEYATAIEWLREFADACGCPMERVFVIPGNHDVDRSVITRSPAVRNAQAAIMRADPHHRERELRIQFGDQDSGRALVAPLEAYNEFAKVFNCQVYPPEHLYWKQDLLLEGGVRLRVHGLTSTLLSGANGRDDSHENLYLSPLQTVLDPVDDIDAPICQDTHSGSVCDVLTSAEVGHDALVGLASEETFEAPDDLTFSPAVRRTT